MTASIKSLVASCFTAAESFAAKVDALRAALPATALESHAACMDALRPATAAYYGIALTVKESGRAVFPADDARTPAAKKQLQRLAKAVLGDQSARADAEEECEVPAELLAAAAKLAKLANEYEGARKLASRAIAAAFAK